MTEETNEAPLCEITKEQVEHAANYAVAAVMSPVSQLDLQPYNVMPVLQTVVMTVINNVSKDDKTLELFEDFVMRTRADLHTYVLMTADVKGSS